MALHDSSDYLLEVRISGHFFKPRDPGAGSSVPLSIFGGVGVGGKWLGGVDVPGIKKLGAQSQCGNWGVHMNVYGRVGSS